MHDAVASVEPAECENPFSWTRAKSDPRTYLEQRRIFEAARTGSLPALAIEEQAIRLLEAVIPNGPAHKFVQLPGRSREMVYEVENLLGAKLDQSLRLADIAAHVGSSVFHLCRIFRAVTGRPIHRYLTQLRVRAGARAGLRQAFAFRRGARPGFHPPQPFLELVPPRIWRHALHHSSGAHFF